jgi:glycosyltransferase involved in cell wall biosynthesis
MVSLLEYSQEVRMTDVSRGLRGCDNGIDILVAHYSRGSRILDLLESLKGQTFRPIRVIIFDDASPDISRLTAACELTDPQFEVTVRRNIENLGAYGNIMLAAGAGNSCFFMQMPHDDLLVDPQFLESAVSEMVERPEISAVVANSWLGESNSRKLMSIPENLHKVFSGTEFAQQRLFRDLHPSYSAVVLRRRVDRPIAIEELEVKPDVRASVGLEPDDMFSILITNVMDSKVLVRGAVVSIRTVSPESWSATEQWRREGNLGAILQLTHLDRILRKRNIDGWASFAPGLVRYNYTPTRIYLPLLKYIGRDFRIQQAYFAGWFSVAAEREIGRARRGLRKVRLLRGS